MEKAFDMHCHTNYLTHNSSHYDTCIHSKQFFKDRTSKNDHAPWFKWTLSVVSHPNLMLFCLKPVITLRHRQNGRYFTDDTFKCILMKILEFRLNFHLSFFSSSNQQYYSIGSDNGLPPGRPQAIIWLFTTVQCIYLQLLSNSPYCVHMFAEKSDRLNSNTVGYCRTQLTLCLDVKIPLVWTYFPT